MQFVHETYRVETRRAEKRKLHQKWIASLYRLPSPASVSFTFAAIAVSRKIVSCLTRIGYDISRSSLCQMALVLMSVLALLVYSRRYQVSIWGAWPATCALRALLTLLKILTLVLNTVHTEVVPEFIPFLAFVAHPDDTVRWLSIGRFRPAISKSSNESHRTCIRCIK